MAIDQNETRIRLTKSQSEALSYLRSLPDGAYGSWARGRYNVSLRALKLRHPETLDTHMEHGIEFWRLKAGTKAIADHTGESNEMVRKGS